MEIGKKIQKRMNELGINQLDLARESGLSQSYVSSIIGGTRGAKRMSFSTVTALGQALGVDSDFFSIDVSQKQIGKGQANLTGNRDASL